ncbi:hypothetical protein APY04_1187 [Hyphomicrobium sulfonivorans]|uniref:LTXXQ motif family protein n=1 Tax=Hyphomicrobium sulfonivorans TaxID=121290 RepID=A0A109BJL9_HYPSL|nr:Spy/CpxP family protein refolding chaperone [Hyphomicrobium sulfonivorans]KWT69978.1 hypothetical protein APY04_1187 [Hyphomicrobium sulfonivorans]
MNKLSRALAVTLMAATIPATIVLAQQPPADGPAVERSDKHRGPSPEVMARLLDGDIAKAKTALNLTPEQEKLWAPLEEQIRARAADRKQQREEWKKKFEERRAERKEAKEKGEKRERPDLLERVEKRSEGMTKMAERMTKSAASSKEFVATLKPLYDSFSDEQKEVADHVLARFTTGPHHAGKHHGKKMCDKGKRGPHGKHHHHGPRHGGPGPHGDHGPQHADAGPDTPEAPEALDAD